MPTTFVLVHGAWHGAWCWDRVRAGLLDHGHRVVTPTLTGIGERHEQLRAEVDLSTHAADVAKALSEADEPVVLLGHSYAGFVVRQAADQLPDAVAHIVLLDAWFGPDGQSLFDRAPDWFSDALRRSALAEGEGWRIPPPPAELVGVTDPDDVAWVESRVTAHPLATFTQPTRLTGAVDGIPTSAIVVDPSLLPFRAWAEDAGHPTTVIAAGHDAMITSPGAFVDALVTQQGSPR
jgi:pimeloyl-ACP methyl ester carboxylesterase